MAKNIECTNYKNTAGHLIRLYTNIENESKHVTVNSNDETITGYYGDDGMIGFKSLIDALKWLSN